MQKQIYLPDSSAIRLTIARYYTPSHRCIQKDYTLGDEDDYSKELYDRYTHGELYSADSIKVDKSKIFRTANGRIVYGGGGIVPDIFVPNDTTVSPPTTAPSPTSGCCSNMSTPTSTSTATS